MPRIETSHVTKDEYGVFQAVVLVEGTEICVEYAESEQELHTQIAASTDLYIMLYEVQKED